MTWCSKLPESRPWPSGCLLFRIRWQVGGKPHLVFTVWINETSYHIMTSVGQGIYGDPERRNLRTSQGFAALCGEVRGTFQGAVQCSTGSPNVHGATHAPWGVMTSWKPFYLRLLTMSPEHLCHWQKKPHSWVRIPYPRRLVGQPPTLLTTQGDPLSPKA